MTAPAKVEDHEEQAQGLLIEQYQEKQRIAAWLASFSTQAQLCEDMLWDVLVKRLIDNAEGHQLDMIGAIVLEPRRSRPDETYKPYVLARIRINWSQGNPDDVIAVLRIIESAAFRYVEIYPASFEVQYLAPTTVRAGVLGDIASQARAAGMSGEVIHADADDDECFQFVSAAEDEAGDVDAGDTGIGFSGANEDTGGFLSGVYGAGNPNTG
jgi:hypothetical protein